MSSENPEDLRLIYKKIQRALFNERKRREERAEAEELARLAGFTSGSAPMPVTMEDLTVPAEEEQPEAELEEVWSSSDDEEEEEQEEISVPIKMEEEEAPVVTVTTSAAAPVKSLNLDTLAVYASSLYESSTDASATSEEESDDDSTKVEENAPVVMVDTAHSSLPLKKRMSRRITERAQTRSLACALTTKYENLFKSLCNDEISLRDFSSKFANLKKGVASRSLSPQAHDLEAYLDSHVHRL